METCVFFCWGGVLDVGCMGRGVVIWGGKLKNYFCLFSARFAVVIFWGGVIFKTSPPDYVHKSPRQAKHHLNHLQIMKTFSLFFKCFLLHYILKYDIILS